jgi:hypothetical protein
MYRLLLLLAYLWMPLHAASSVPQEKRQQYADYFYHAFYAQCQGHSSAASSQFQVACEEARKAGESAAKIKIMEMLFVWYRTYGNAFGLFAKKPTGYNVIIGEYSLSTIRYRPHNSYYPDSQYYNSEWGNTPEQAALVQGLMTGIGEIISGIFLVQIGSIPVKAAGWSAIADGCTRFWDSGKGLWIMHQRAVVDFQKAEAAMQKLKTELE